MHLRLPIGLTGMGATSLPGAGVLSVLTARGCQNSVQQWLMCVV